MEIINGIEVISAPKIDSPDIDGGTIDNCIIGGVTPAAGNFTTLEASTNPVDADGVGDRAFNDDRYALESNNLSDLDSARTSFDNIKQVATESVTGVSELATDAETVTGTATDRVTTPANITAKMAAPGAIGGTTPAVGVFTTIEATGQLQGALINNQMVQKATFDILGLMTDPRFLNLQCEDPGAGTMTDVSGQGHDGTYEGSMTTGDRVKGGMGWVLDFDGVDDYVNLGNGNDFSFGNGSDDEAVTWFGVLEVVDSDSTQIITSKRDDTTANPAREWVFHILSDEKMRLTQYDESVDAYCYRRTVSGVSAGWHSYVVTSPGDGGASAMDNVKIYIDGTLVASTATNSGTYVAMENLATPLLIGAYESTTGAISAHFKGDIALTGIDGSEWSAFDAHRFHQICKGLYAI